MTVDIKLVPILKSGLMAVLFLQWPCLAHAADGVPDAGSILQEVQPALPPEPSSGESGLKIEPEASGKLPETPPFEVRSIRITGNTQFDTAQLHALVADSEGQSLTLQQLQAVASRLTDFYNSHGYLLDRAIIPAQTIQEGVVEIRIIEAHYGKIALDNSSKVRDGLLKDTLAPLQPGQSISRVELDRTLLLLTDIPGILTSATIKPGEAPGTSDLMVGVSPDRAVTGNVDVDNFGNRYTGKNRITGQVTFVNPAHHGDYLNLNAMSSGSGLDFGRMTYETLLTGKGMRMGGSWSSLHYTLGDTLSNLKSHGTAAIGSLWLKRPLVRSQQINLYGQVQYDRKQLKDHTDLASIRTDRHLKNVTLTLNGDVRDRFFSTAVSSWNVNLMRGFVGFDDAAAKSYDATHADVQGYFVKWNAALTRLQSLDTNNSLYLSLQYQTANRNLDPSEKMVAGGPNAVRAYDTSAVSGDTGYVFSGEIRHIVADTRQGQWQLVAFADHARISQNKHPLSSGNNVKLSGAGFGLNWTDMSWTARLQVAERIGTLPQMLSDAPSTRVWLEIGKGF